MTTMQQVADGQTYPEVPINENFEAVSAFALFGKRHPVTSGLTWGYYGGYYDSTLIADGTVTLTNAATNYVVVERATGVVSVSTSNTNWNDTTDYGRLYLLTTAGSAVTDEQDHRFGASGILTSSGGGGAVTAKDVTIADSDSQFAGQSVEEALEELAAQLDQGFTAKQIAILDSDSRYAGSTVEEALEELGAALAGAVLSVNGQTGAVTLTAKDINILDSDSRYSGQSIEEALEEIGASLAASSTVGKHAIYIAAGSMRPSVTGGCALLASIASASNQPDITTLDFDPTTQEYCQFGIVMPKSWNEGTVTFRAHWSHPATVTNFGVVWDLQAVAVSDDDAIAVAFGTAQTSTGTGGTTNDLYTSPESSAITVAGTPAAEDMVFFRLSRVTGNGSDTMAVDARLHGITLYITTDAGNDA